MSRNASAVLILLVSTLSYANSLQSSFHYDDHHSIVDNPSIRTLTSIWSFFVDSSTFSGDADKSMYRPLLLVSYAVNYWLGEYEVLGYHLVNILLHAGCALLCWVVFELLLKDLAPDRSSVGGRAAMFAGLLFATHPLAAEPVNYISGRSDLMSTCFYLAALALFMQWRRVVEGSPQRFGPVLRISSLICFACGLLTKSTVITFPVILLLIDALSMTGMRRRGFRHWLRFHSAYWVVAGGYLVLLRSTEFLERSLANPARELGAQLITQAKAPAYYLKLAFMPVNLNVEHQFAESTVTSDAVWVAGLLVLSICVLLWFGRQWSTTVFPVLWAGIVVLPVSVMPLNVLVNERRLYLALAAFAWFVVLILGRRLRRLSYVWLSLLCLSSVQRNEVWATEVSLWRDAVDKAPAMYRAQTNLGKALQMNGDEQGALAAYQRAIDIDPRHGDAYNNVGILHHRQGRTREAIDWYQRAVERYPDHEEIYQNTADAFADLGDLAQARVWYEKALTVDDRRGAIWANYGELLFQLKDLDSAERASRRAIVLMPQQPEPYNNLGNVLSSRGEGESALAMYQRAIDLAPENAISDVRANMADTYLQMGRAAEARVELEIALEHDPENARLHRALGRALGMLGDKVAAISVFQRAIALEPGAKRNHAELADLLRINGRHAEAISQYENALAIDSAYARALYGLAMSQDAAERRGAAATTFRRFLEVWRRRDEKLEYAKTRLRELAP